MIKRSVDERVDDGRLLLQDMFLLATMGPPGGGRTHISGRLQSRFNLINMTFPNVRLLFGFPLGTNAEKLTSRYYSGELFLIFAFTTMTFLSHYKE